MEREPLIPEIKVDVSRGRRFLTLEGEVNGDFVQLAITSTPNSEQIEDALNLVRFLNGKNPIKVIPFHEKYVVISANEKFEIFDQPQLSTSLKHGSGSQYLGQTKNREVLIQAQPPATHSSKHSHDGKEMYMHVDGTLRIRVSSQEQEQELELSDDLPLIYIQAHMTHQIFNDAPELAISVLICSFSFHRYCD